MAVCERSSKSVIVEAVGVQVLKYSTAVYITPMCDGVTRINTFPKPTTDRKTTVTQATTTKKDILKKMKRLYQLSE